VRTAIFVCAVIAAAVTMIVTLGFMPEIFVGGNYAE
jgi:hypothetical protein